MLMATALFLPASTLHLMARTLGNISPLTSRTSVSGIESIASLVTRRSLDPLWWARSRMRRKVTLALAKTVYMSVSYLNVLVTKALTVTSQALTGHSSPPHPWYHLYLRFCLSLRHDLAGSYKYSYVAGIDDVNPPGVLDDGLISGVNLLLGIVSGSGRLGCLGSIVVWRFVLAFGVDYTPLC